ncbi:hypothetical protein NM688_g2139 [Phlebia brevispora]|uniref:Uncharacterized protein n=1 Tax=Phlebia brevispora TaxID=194682 RepID=A0ACC1T9G5_9APHY|nr:hypothetical protein NM688_g2139 [Phlebia brevispora]
MEAFRLLSRGGAQFDKKKFQKDVELFEKSRHPDKGKGIAKHANEELPAELDFFKYAQGGTSGASKRKADDKDAIQALKKVKLDDDPGYASTDDEQVPSSSMPRQRVTAKGNNVPDPVDTFEALKERYNVSARLLSNLVESGYKQPTGIQSHGVPILLESRDLAAISPTGTGKTLSYLLPIMSLLSAPSSSKTDVGKGVRALILAPTRELAHQIHNECLKLAQGRKWRIILFSKATASTLADKDAQVKVDIIISTPLRMVSAVQNGKLELSNVRHVVLDEADRMLDSEFLTQVQEVLAACTHPNLQKAVFSATLPANAEQLAMGMLQDPIRVVVGLKDTPLPLIAQSLTYVADDSSKLPTLLQYLSEPFNPPLLVFVSSQPRASSLAEELVLSGIQNVDCLHAGMTKKEREDAVSRMRKGESWVMVSTEVMARGMDFKGVREVINYDFPQSVQSYVHRIGRTGRAGREGKAITYFTDEDAPFLKTPSKMKRREMGKVKRADLVNSAGRIGRAQAIRKRDMIAGSKRRKQKEHKSVRTNASAPKDSGVNHTNDKEAEEVS